MKFFNLVFLLFCALPVLSQTEDHPPNFIIIFADDLGYGDLGAYGHPSIRTPHLDRMAAEGQKWTNFYAPSSVCTPSRAGIMTGRLPVRNGMTSQKRRVLFPNSALGLPPSEITLATQLKKAEYRTACIGKWHLGHKSPFLPTDHGFDYYFGIPYSNDMNLDTEKGYVEYFSNPDSMNTEDFRVPILRNKEVVELPANQHTITGRYTDETIQFIRENKDQPFFIYLAHSMPHIPLFVSEDFADRSKAGLYGDVIEEIDHGVGRILSALEEEGLSENTLVVFTSDNGPWLLFGIYGGNAGPLYAGKGMTWEGGMRVPGLFWWPGKIAPGVITDPGSALDLFTTFSSLAGLELPRDRIIDGKDLSGTLLEAAPGPRNEIFYYRGPELYAVRTGNWKAHFITQGEYGTFGPKELHDPPLLYHLGKDPGEKYNVAQQHPEVLERIRQIAEQHQAGVEPYPDQLSAIESKE